MELKVAELMVLDLTKKCNAVNNRLKESNALFEVVKNERNKYLGLIQASTQALAEMKEKIKILTSEVEILRLESHAKEKALAKEVSVHGASKANRDALHLELNRGQQEYKRRQEGVQSQIEEVKALNSTINRQEREMLRLKRKYEDAVAKRNDRGVMLIDLNDELCVLYEKVNLQEKTLERGEVEIKAREHEVRALRLELSDLERQLKVARKRKPQGGDLARRYSELEEELSNQRAKTTALCLELESPENANRYRMLEGKDPDLPELSARVSELEQRLDEKKSLLMDKQLVLEEVSTLTQKLKNRAGDGKEGTQKMTSKVSSHQSKIRDVTRTMMATVSELSMYQATAMKLQQEKKFKREQLEEAKRRVAHGQAPTDEAEREWYHMEQTQAARQETRLQARLATMAAEGPSDPLAGPQLAVRTTAEPRPSAYIPDELGIPKPYGAFPPHKPSEAGATMRHMRNPVPKDIEI